LNVGGLKRHKTPKPVIRERRRLWGWAVLYPI